MYFCKLCYGVSRDKSYIMDDLNKLGLKWKDSVNKIFDGVL